MLGFLGLLQLKRDYREIAALQAVYSIAGSMHLAENVRHFMRACGPARDCPVLQETVRSRKRLFGLAVSVWPCIRCAGSRSPVQAKE
jgi:hypothetical protein